MVTVSGGHAGPQEREEATSFASHSHPGGVGAGWSVRITDVCGALLIVGALAVTSSGLIETLRVVPADQYARLEMSATIFRAALVMLGLLVIGLGRAPIWHMGVGRAATEAPSSRATVVILSAMLLLATGLRLYDLGNGLWYDEILTNVSYARMTFGEIVSTYDSQNQHFLFSLMAQAAFLLFGESPWALRLPAVIFGVGSIWAMYLFTREVGSQREALISAALLTVSYHHIWFSQNARGYTALLFWTLLASWLYVRAMREGRPSLWIWYAVAAALGLYSHMTMLFVIAGHGLSFCIRTATGRAWLEPRTALGLFLGFGLTGFLIFLLHALVLLQMLAGEGIHEVSTVPAWTNPLWTIIEVTRGLQVGFASGIIGILAAVVFGIGMLGYARTQPVVLELLFVPCLLCAAVVVGMGHHLWPRFFFFAMGFAAAVAVRGVFLVGSSLAARLAERPLSRQQLGTLFGAALVLASAVAVPFVYRPKQDFVGALLFIEANREAGDAVVVAGLATLPYTKLYQTDWREIESEQQLNEVRAHARRIWLVYTLSTHMEANHAGIMREARSSFEFLRRFDGSVGDGAVYVYRTAGG